VIISTEFCEANCGAVAKPNLFPYIPQHCPQTSSFYTHLPAYEDGTDRVFRNVGI